MKVGEALRVIRKQKRITLEDVERITGIDTGNLSRMENGKQGITQQNLEKWVEAIGCKVSDVYQLTESGKHPADDKSINDDRYVMVPRLALRVAAGNGHAVEEHVEIQHTLAFRREWLAKKGLKHDNLEVFTAAGDSMHPYISDGDVVLVDITDTQPRTNEVFVIWQPEPLGIRVKRLLVRENGDLIVRSDNTDKSLYPDEPAKHDDIRVIGRVTWRGG